MAGKIEKQLKLIKNTYSYTIKKIESMYSGRQIVDKQKKTQL
jgi:hypothetical protein